MSRLSELYRKIKYRVIAVAVLIAIFTTCVAPVSGLAAESIKVLGNGTITVYEWKLVQSNDDLYRLYNSNKVRHCLFVYNKGDNDYRYVSNYTDGDEWKTMSVSNYKEIKVGNSRFITTSDLMTPVLIGVDQDPDWRYYCNGGKPYIYRFKIGQFTDDPSMRTGHDCGNRVMKSWDGSDCYIDNAYLPDSYYRDALYLDPESCMNYAQHKIGAQFSIAKGDIFYSDGSYTTSFGGNGWVKVWHTCSGKWTKDEGWWWSSKGNWLGCNSDKDWSDYDNFKMWISEPHTFSVIKQNYTIDEGQVVTVDGTKSHCMLYENYTLTVKDGGVLNIKGKFINNGIINCDGGTIIMHEGACMFPYNTETNQRSSSGATGVSALNIKGGELIILSGATLAYDSLHDEAIRVTDSNNRMGKIINYGNIFATGIRLKNSVVYNEAGGKLALGRSFEDGFSVTSNSTTVDNMGVIRNSALSSASWGTFATIDTDSNDRNKSSVIVNNGSINLQNLPGSTVTITNKAPTLYR